MKRINNDITDNYRALALWVVGAKVGDEIHYLSLDSCLYTFKLKNKRERFAGNKVKVTDLITGEVSIKDSFKKVSNTFNIPIGCVAYHSKINGTYQNKYKLELV